MQPLQVRWATGDYEADVGSPSEQPRRSGGDRLKAAFSNAPEAGGREIWHWPISLSLAATVGGLRCFEEAICRSPAFAGLGFPTKSTAAFSASQSCCQGRLARERHRVARTTSEGGFGTRGEGALSDWEPADACDPGGDQGWIRSRPQSLAQSRNRNWRSRRQGALKPEYSPPKSHPPADPKLRGKQKRNLLRKSDGTRRPRNGCGPFVGR